MGYKVKPKGCSEPECDKTYVPHEWGAKKAQREGWFLQMNGDSWCPDHNPPWVKEWRNKKRREKYQAQKLDADTLRDLSEFQIRVNADETLAFFHNKNCTHWEDLDTSDPELDSILMKAVDHLKECTDGG